MIATVLGGIESAENIRHDEFLPDGRLTEACWSKKVKIQENANSEQTDECARRP